MGSNVIGVPITDETLKAMEKYKYKEITRWDRAYEAMNMRNDGDKNDKARQYVNGLKSEYGDGISTLIMLYNSTGDPIHLVNSHEWYGHLYKDPYPQELANGQWGVFLHVKPDWPNLPPHGSFAGVAYRGKNKSGHEYDYMFSWGIPYSGDNKAYTMVREVNHFESKQEWEALARLLDESGESKKDEWEGCVSKVSIGGGTTAVYEALLTLEKI